MVRISKQTNIRITLIVWVVIGSLVLHTHLSITIFMEMDFTLSLTAFDEVGTPFKMFCLKKLDLFRMKLLDVTDLSV